MGPSPASRKPGTNLRMVQAGWGIEAGGKGGGNAGERTATLALALALIERAIDRPAIALNHIQRGAVIAPKHPMPMLRPIRPNGNPTRIVKKRVSK